jgi:hypothetical protein
MTTDDIQDFESQTSQGTVYIRIITMENGHLVLISDSERYRLGLSAIAIPAGHGRNEPTSVDLVSMGLESDLVRLIAEGVSAWTNQACMILVGMKNLDRLVMMDLTLFLKNHFMT